VELRWRIALSMEEIKWRCGCRYTEDQVPHIQALSKKQGAERVSMHCYLRCSFRSHLLTEVDFDAATCPTVPDLTSLLRWAPVLLRVPQLRTLPPWQGELQCCHMSHGCGLCLSERRALMLSRTPRPQRAVDHRNKERSSCSRHTNRLVCFQSTLKRYWGACKTCGHAATVWFNSAIPAQLTTPEHGYSGDTTR
jgi:hypothetical protein